MSNHTPGPWCIDTETRPMEVCTIYHLADNETNGQGYAYVRGALGYWQADEAEQMANAHLIAAAPDLLEALDAHRTRIDKLHSLMARLLEPAGSRNPAPFDNNRFAEAVLRLFDNANAVKEMHASGSAIAKARGES